MPAPSASAVSLARRLLRRVPMPLLAVLIGLLVGFVVWKVLDGMQSRALQDMFQAQLRSELDQRARESLIRFERFVDGFASTARLLAGNRFLADYLDQDPWAKPQASHPAVREGPQPPWLKVIAEWKDRERVRQILLFDVEGRLREIYPLGPEPLPPALKKAPVLNPKAMTSPLAFATIETRPYLLVSQRLENDDLEVVGTLMLVAPLDERFLMASQYGATPADLVIALADPDTQEVVTSSDDRGVPVGDVLTEIGRRYFVTAQSLSEYGSSDWSPLFATFVLQQGVKTTVKQLMHLERRQRLIVALTMIGVFSALFGIVSGRINRVLRRIAEFSRRGLGAEAPEPQAGNQLLILEERIRELIGLVIRAREQMRVQHETEIQESEAIRAAIMASSLDAIVTIDDTGRILDFNPTAERQFGHPEHEVVGRGVSELMFDPDSREAFGQLLDDCRRVRQPSDESLRAELMAVHGDASAFPVEVSIKPFRLHDRLLFAVYLRDISERRRQEREIQSLAAFPGESPSPILRVDRRGLVLYANEPSAPLLAHWGCGLGQALPAEWQGPVRDALEDGRDRQQELDCGGRVFSLLLAPIRDFGYVNIYARDITETRAAEAQSRKHQSELVHVCRLSTMGETATGIAHELNQPLAAIINYANGCARRLRSGRDDKAELLDALERIGGQATRAAEIIKRLRAMVGKQAPSRIEVDLNDLVREVCGFIEFDVHRIGATIDLQLAAERLPVNVDLVQIEQVILNLLRNALDALDALPKEAERRVTLRTGHNAAQVFVAVEDSGTGIRPQLMERLFDPFFTTKESGMGMGLTISQTIVADHNGKIRAESWPGRGAMFIVELPASADTRPEPAVAV
jgi:two-component system sensor kinase FixL